MKYGYLSKLAAVRHITTNEPVLLKVGEQGYYPWPENEGRSVELFNACHGLSKADVQAIEAGSITGRWDIPGANPDTYKTPHDVAFQAIYMLRMYLIRVHFEITSIDFKSREWTDCAAQAMIDYWTEEKPSKEMLMHMQRFIMFAAVALGRFATEVIQRATEGTDIIDFINSVTENTDLPGEE